MSANDFEAFLKAHHIDEVECLVPDVTGTARGKILPAAKFLKGSLTRELRIPEDVFILTVTGSYAWKNQTTDDASIDVYMRPDAGSIRFVPWYQSPTAQVICDCFYLDNRPVDLSPRSVLMRILGLYAAQGWKPVVAPELEFYLVNKNLDPDYPLEAPAGTSGRSEKIGQAYGIDAANDFDPIVDDLYDFCSSQRIDIDTVSHESGPAQLEINFNHGDPLELADQVFLFKRTVRQAALRHDIYATFMAKPHANQPGSSMHIHQSVMDVNTGKNIFALENNGLSPLLLSHIGGLQKYTGAALPFYAPNVNSYRRLIPNSDAPTNTHWGIDNRTAPFRVPTSDCDNRRVENRIPGADANPYLAIAASLAAGYLGMMEGLSATDSVVGSAYDYPHTIPLHLEDALNSLGQAPAFQSVLGERFIRAFQGVKEEEMEQYRKVISSWEREFLLLNV